MKRTAIALFAVALSACSMSPARFSPGDADTKQFSRDDYECERDAMNLPRGDACDQMAMYERCMKSKGYIEVPGSASKGMCARVF